MGKGNAQEREILEANETDRNRDLSQNGKTFVNTYK